MGSQATIAGAIGYILLGGVIMMSASQVGAQVESDWMRVAEHAAFHPRDTAEGVVFQNKMWISNGYCPPDLPGVVNRLIRDLWNSSDGVTWTRVLDQTPYDGYAEMVVFDNKMWAIKGSVWNSADGVTWTKVLDKTPFGGRGYGEVVLHEGKMWQLGSGADVWCSSDGVSWTRVLDKAPYGNRWASAVGVLGGKLYLLGGCIQQPNDPPEKGYPKFSTFNDVWSSPDGVTWTRVVEHAPWPRRMWSVTITYANRLWLIGGYNNVVHANFDDVWYTEDGTNWTQLVTKTKFTPRHEVTTYDYKGSLWVVAGNMWPLMNDVWRLEPPMK